MGLDPRVYPRAGLTALSSIVCIFAFFLPLAFGFLDLFSHHRDNRAQIHSA